MRKLKTTNITTNAQAPIKSGTLVHLQAANEEVFTAVGRALAGGNYSSATGYIAYGCTSSLSGSTWTITAGAVFYDGEFYLVDATTFNVTGGQVPVAVLEVTQFTTNADPVLFTNGQQYNIHDVRKIKIQAGASGSGLFNLSAAVRLNREWVTLNSTAGTISPSGSAITAGAYRYIIEGAKVTLNFKITFDIGTLGPGFITVPLPIAATGATYNVPAYMYSGTSGLNYLIECKTNGANLEIGFFDVPVNTGYYVLGQIVYGI